MAEYWKSTPNYWCKHCKTYIRDTPFERNQHEATGKHQGNLKRFLRDIHRSKEQEERENNKAKNEVQRLKGLIGSGPEGGGGGQQQQQKDAAWKRSSGAGGATAPASRSAAAQDRKKQMAQLAEMGVAIPDQFRAEMALAGEWKAAEPESGKDSEAANKELTAAATAVGVRKRKHQADAGDGEESGPRKAWGSAIRRYPGGGGDVDEELEALLGSTGELKDKKTKSEAVKTEDGDAEIKRETAQTPVKQEDAEGVSGDDAVTQTKAEPEDTDEVKPEEETAKKTLDSVPAATADTPLDTPPVVFKKRKPKQTKR